MRLCQLPQAGQVVRVRQRRYVVDAERPGDSTLVRLSCIDDDAQGQALKVFWEREVDPDILADEDWRERSPPRDSIPLTVSRPISTPSA